MNNQRQISEKNTMLASMRAENTLDNDNHIFDQVILGDEVAFELLFKKYYVLLSHYGYSFVKNREEAEEIVQDTFVNIWDSKSSIRITTTFQKYVYSAVKNRCLNAIRNKGIRRGHLKIISDTRTHEVPSVDEELYADELKERLFLSIESLPPKCKRIFQMSRIEGLRHKEISSLLDITPKTVENQIGIALRFLRHHLSDFIKVVVIFSILNF